MKNKASLIILSVAALIVLLSVYKGATHIFQRGVVSNTQSKVTIPTTSTSTDALPVMNEKHEEETITQIAHDKGVAAAFDYLKQAWSKRAIQAHVLAHLIGRLDYEERGIAGLSLCDSSFAFGCYHGFIAEMVKQHGDQGVDIARKGCHALANTGDVTACLHGLGHGVMEWKGDIRKAIARCQLFASADRPYCFDGAFMDYDIDAMQYLTPTDVSSTAPWSFCDDMPQASKPMCIRNHTFLLISSQKIPVPRIAADCSLLPKDLKEMCVSSIGIYSADKIGRSAMMTQSVCSAFTDKNDASACAMYAAEEFVFEKGDAIAKQICQSLSDPWQTSCLNAVKFKQASYGRSDINP